MKRRNFLLMIAAVCMILTCAANAGAAKAKAKAKAANVKGVYPLMLSTENGAYVSNPDLQDRIAVGIGRNFYLGGEADADGDGVVNEMDDCPDTLAGVQVDQRGCWVVAFFGLGKSKIANKYYKNLNQVVDILKSHPGMKVEIQGHTCTIGSSNGNQILSEKRAKAVYDYIVKKGIDGSRLTCKGYSFSRPAAANKTAAGRSHNRRVTLQPGNCQAAK